MYIAKNIPYYAATQKSFTFFLALKGRNIPAQGNARFFQGIKPLKCFCPYQSAAIGWYVTPFQG